MKMGRVYEILEEMKEAKEKIRAYQRVLDDPPVMLGARARAIKKATREQNKYRKRLRELNAIEIGTPIEE